MGPSVSCFAITVMRSEAATKADAAMEAFWGSVQTATKSGPRGLDQQREMLHRLVVELTEEFEV